MAGLGNISIHMATRPCEVRNLSDDSKCRGAIFHCWAQDGNEGDGYYPVAVVEYDDGQCARVSVERVKFLDAEDRVICTSK